MDRTRKRDGRTDGQCDYYMPPKVPLGHKKLDYENYQLTTKKGGKITQYAKN